MVRYYGRARQRTGSVNTNQIGLNMSGNGRIIGHKNINTIKNRIVSNQKFYGPIYYQGQLWNTNEGCNCVKKAPLNQGLSGGVGRINNPRTKCNINCTSSNYDSSNYDFISTGITFIPETLNIKDSNSNTITTLGYASADLLKKVQNNGSIESNDITDTGQWILYNITLNNSGIKSVVFVYTPKNKEDETRIKNITPTLNNTMSIGNFINNSYIYNFSSIFLEKDTRYTLSF
jgi:hypothetical protein